MFGPERTEPLDDAIDRLDALVAWFEEHPDREVQDRAIALLQAVDAVHRPGLARLATCLAHVDPSARRGLLAERPVRLLLELYDLRPADAPAEPAFVPLADLKIVRARRP